MKIPVKSSYTSTPIIPRLGISYTGGTLEESNAGMILMTLFTTYRPIDVRNLDFNTSNEGERLQTFKQ